MPSDPEIQELLKEIKKFRDDRDWGKLHDGKNLAINLSIEAGELLEVFLWKSNEEISTEKFKDELGDVLYTAFLLADTYGLDIPTVIREKLKKNEKKYPIDKFKGSKKKHDEE